MTIIEVWWVWWLLLRAKSVAQVYCAQLGHVAVVAVGIGLVYSRSQPVYQRKTKTKTKYWS